MLFSYTYVPHKIEKMQQFLDFIFSEVWCKAPIGLEFHPDLFKDYPELHDVMSEFGFSKHAPERGRAFYRDVKAIYQLFASLSSQEIDQFKNWYQANNNIESVCANDPSTQLIRYADIPVAYKELRDQLSSFFKELYSQSLLDLAALRAKIGEINDHYKNFVKINTVGKCPFCGISDLYSEYQCKREAYDHYLPKALYPFNSINFKNLVPACHKCNSSYKTSKDPAHQTKDPAHGAQRRKFFYPYRTSSQPIEIALTVEKADVSSLGPQDIGVHFGPAALDDEIATWRDVYGIDERYRAKVLGENDGKYWITQVLDEWKGEGKSPDEFLQTLARQTSKNPWAEANFLKMPFLEACRAKGVFDAADPL